jgi:uncharacterized membrane protein
MRRSITVLALIGCFISTYLTLYQWHVTAGVWDPLFGSASSEAVLTSSLSRALPIPDATLGAIAYLVEAVLSLSEDERLELVLNVLVILMAATGLVLVGVQLLVVHALCTLCICSAAASWIIAVLARPIGGIQKSRAIQHAS